MSMPYQGYRPPRTPQGGNGGRVPQRGRNAAPANGRGSRPPRRRRRIWPIILIIVILALVATFFTLRYVVTEAVESVVREGTFYPGIYIDGVQLYGYTPDEAAEGLYNRASEAFANWSVTLTHGDNRWEINTNDLGMTHSLRSTVAQEVNKAFMIGREEGSLLEKYQTIEKLKTEPYISYTGTVEKNMGRIDELLGQIADTLYVAPQDATWRFDDTRQNPIVITEEVVGLSVDVATLRTQLESMVGAMQSGEIAIELVETPPTVTAASISEEIVLLSSFSTVIDKSSTDDRNRNIELGCDQYNGLKVSPGNKVSFNKVVGKRTEANGYFPALEIVRGALEWGWGGGICQVSSTLYNAVVGAGLEVITRYNHGISVNYLPMGMDATVTNDSKDFVFRNNTGSDIYIIARLTKDGNNKICLFQIYGRPDPNGYTYHLEVDDPVEDEPIPAPTTTTDKSAVSNGKPGYKVQRYLVTVHADTNTVVSKEPIGVDTYSPIKPKVYVGYD